MNSTSPSFSFDQQNFQHTLKVFGWTVLSAFTALLLANLASVNVPPQYLFLVPIVNTALVALKEWASTQQRS